MNRVLKTAAAAFFLAAAFSPAQALVVGQADQANSMPFGYDSTASYYYQQIYSSTSFNAPMDISRLTFYSTVNPGGSPNTGDYRIYLSTTTAPVNNIPTAFPTDLGALTKVFEGTLPSLSNGRLDFVLSSTFHYDPSQGNLLLTVFNALNGTYDTSFFLDADKNGVLFGRRWSSYGGTTDIGLVTGFNDVSAVPLPAALPLFASGLGLIGFGAWRRKRKAAAVAA